jgi:S1-C subfamily serine protease
MSPSRSQTPSLLVSALLGGLVVAAFGWIAIISGWVEAEQAEPVAAGTPAPTLQGAGAGGSTVADADTAIGRVYESAERGVAHIEAERAGGGSGTDPFDPGGGTATGSGFVIDAEGHVLTNHHVVEGADTIRLRLGDSDSTHDAELVGSDPATDLALLQVDAPADVLEPLPLGRSSALEVGDPVIAIGNPFGLDRTVTAGIVSALQRQIEAPNGFSISDVIQTDAAINPGNSGGPLIDAEGAVIGVNSQIESSSGGNVGIGFAVPIDTAREVVEQLLEDGSVSHAYLGISGATVDASVADRLDLEVEAGALVDEVVPGSPAADAGLRRRDIVTEVDGARIGSMDEVISAVNGADPGDRLELTVERDGAERPVTVELGERSA